MDVTDEVNDISWTYEACRNTTKSDTGYEKSEQWIANEMEQQKADEAHKHSLELMRQIKLRNFQRELERQEQTRIAELELEREMLKMKRMAEERFQKRKEELSVEHDGSRAISIRGTGSRKAHENARDDRTLEDQTQNPVNQTQLLHNATNHRAIHPD